MIFTIFLMLAAWWPFASTAASVRLAWDANAESDLAGYRVYRESNEGGIPVTTNNGLETQVLVGDLVPGRTYRFWVTAYNSAGLESDPSNQVIYEVPLNLPPVAESGTLTLPEDSSGPLVLVGRDPEGIPVQYVLLDGPHHGTLSGTAPNLIYRPDADFYGDDSISFRVSDGELASPSATVRLVVTPVEDAVEGRADRLMVVQGGTANRLSDGTASVLANDGTADTGVSVAKLQRLPRYGTVDLGADGQFVYRHDGSPVADDSFSYCVEGTSARSAEILVRIDVLFIRSMRPSGADLWVDFPVVAGERYQLDQSVDSPSSRGSWSRAAEVVASGDADASVVLRGAALSTNLFYRLTCFGSGGGSLGSEVWGYWTPAPAPRQVFPALYRGPAVRRSPVISALGNAITLEGRGWRQGELARVQGIPSHVAMVVSSPTGAGVGSWWPVQDNDASWIYLQLAQRPFSANSMAGSVVEIARLPSVADIFGDVRDPNRRLAIGDSVVMSAEAGVETWSLFCKADPQGVPGYYISRLGVVSGPFDGTTLFVLPAQTMNYQRSTTASPRAAVLGRVQSSAFMHYLMSGFSYTASAFPVPMNLGTSGLASSGWIADVNFVMQSSQEDCLMLPQGSSYMPMFAFFHSGSVRPRGWYWMWGTSCEPAEIPAGVPVQCYLRPRSGPLLWLEEVPWR